MGDIMKESQEGGDQRGAGGGRGIEAVVKPVGGEVTGGGAGGLGEVEGRQVISAAKSKLARLNRNASKPSITDLGIPVIGDT